MVEEVRKKDGAHQKMMTRKVTINLNMLGTLIENRVFSNLNGALIVTINWSSTRWKDAKFIKKSSKPNNFSTNRSHGSIFRFDEGSKDHLLFFTFPRE